MPHSRGWSSRCCPASRRAALASFAGLAFGWLQAPSVEGRKIMDQIDGLREYLSVAEEERLEYLNPPEKTPETVRALPALCGRARRGEYLGEAFRRRAGGGRGAAAPLRTASSWYSGDRDIGPAIPSRSPTTSAASCPSTIASASTAPGSSDSSAAAAAAAAPPAAAAAAAAARAGDRRRAALRHANFLLNRCNRSDG